MHPSVSRHSPLCGPHLSANSFRACCTASVVPLAGKILAVDTVGARSAAVVSSPRSAQTAWKARRRKRQTTLKWVYRGHEKPASSFRQEQAGAPENVDMKMAISGLSYTQLCLPALISPLRVYSFFRRPLVSTGSHRAASEWPGCSLKDLTNHTRLMLLRTPHDLYLSNQSRPSSIRW